MIKKFSLWLCLGIVILFLADRTVTGLQASRFLQRVDSERPFEALTRRISVGMSKREVESLLAGFREVERAPVEEGYVVSYGYWFGFLPPKGIYRLKFWGAIVVTYSPEDKVLEASYWYN